MTSLREVKAASDNLPHGGVMQYPAPSPRQRVFIVDDDAAVRAALIFALELEGFEVEGLGSGEALVLCDLPDAGTCLVVDERLPGMTGLEALRRLRRRDVKLPALLITSHPDLRLRAAARLAGVPILEKPLLGDALSNAIRAALRT
jgi:FixJ family two-component response regulator